IGCCDDSRTNTDSSNASLKASLGHRAKSREQVCFAGCLHNPFKGLQYTRRTMQEDTQIKATGRIIPRWPNLFDSQRGDAVPDELAGATIVAIGTMDFSRE